MTGVAVMIAEIVVSSAIEIELLSTECVAIAGQWLSPKTDRITNPIAYKDRYHFPEERKGCYYEKPTQCCWLCLMRFKMAS